MSTDQVTAEVLRRAGARFAFVFGSRAHGTAGEDYLGRLDDLRDLVSQVAGYLEEGDR